MPTEKKRLLEYYEILITFNRFSLICQTTAKTLFDYFEALFQRETAIHLQKPTEQRIRSLMKVFFFQQ